MTCSALKCIVPLMFLSFALAWSLPQAPPPGEEPFETAEGLVAALYESVTFEAGGTPDWDHVRSMFIDDRRKFLSNLVNSLVPGDLLERSIDSFEWMHKPVGVVLIIANT